MKKLTFALYFGNRGFFPGELIASARNEIKEAVEKLGHETIIMGEEETRYGAVETVSEGRKYAKFLKEHHGKYDGVILSLANFGDENGAIEALSDCGTPILIQAYPDEIGKMDFQQRRDAFCGKISIMNVFYQNELPYTAFKPHVIHPSTEGFRQQLEWFSSICRVVKGMKRIRVGAIGARTTAFKTTRFDELALQKSGITTETLDLSELFNRVRKIKKESDRYIQKYDKLKSYTNWCGVPEDKIDMLTKTGVALDEIIEEYYLDCIGVRCWNEIEIELGISPCVLLSELNDRGIAASCETDVCNALSMHALSLASGKAPICLDWNNNYSDIEDKCILFHCGPVPQSLMTEKGQIIEHPMFAKSFGAGCGWGCNVGRIAKSPMTFTSFKTEDGKLVYYIGEGKFTGEEIEEEFFGCAGVAEIPSLQDKLLKLSKNGFRHHVSVTFGEVEVPLKEAFNTYLGYDLMEW